MTDKTSPPPTPDHRDRFLAELAGSLNHFTFVKLVLAKYRGKEPGLQRLQIRQVVVKGQRSLSVIHGYKTREITKNYSVAEGLAMIAPLLGHPFLSAHLFTLTETVQMEFTKKGHCTWGSSKGTRQAAPSEQHDREKERFLDPAKPFLAALGITDEHHGILPSMSRKWKQINKFLEIFQHAFTTSELAQATTAQVVDFGSGKGYLTFAIHDYLRDTLKVDAQVTGIERREELVGFCNAAAQGLPPGTLQFRQGEVGSQAPEPIDIMMALHACDTATDQAIHLGIRAGARIIMCAPCCHKQIRPQIRPPDILAPMLQFGIHLGQEAEMLTDTLRALLLEANGYTTRILEFVSLEHTSKNKMLLAVKQPGAVDRDGLLAKVANIKTFYGIQEHHLETLLRADSGPATL